MMAISRDCHRLDVGRETIGKPDPGCVRGEVSLTVERQRQQFADVFGRKGMGAVVLSIGKFERGPGICSQAIGQCPLDRRKVYSGAGIFDAPFAQPECLRIPMAALATSGFAGGMGRQR